MARIITVNAFHLGAGASTITANTAALLAQQGQRVAVVDAAISTPTQHLLFRLDEDACRYTLNDFLLGRCKLHETVVQPANSGLAGRLFVVPSSSAAAAVGKVLREPYDFDLLPASYLDLAERLNLDILLVDAEVAQHESTLASMAASHAVLAVVQLDLQQYHSIGITVELANQMQIPLKVMAVNFVPAVYDPDNVRNTLQETYGWPVAALLGYCDELMALSSGDVFALRYPSHPTVAAFQQIVDALMC